MAPASVTSPARLVVLVSGSGTNLQALLDAASSEPPAEPAAAPAAEPAAASTSAPAAGPASVQTPAAALAAEVVAVGADRSPCRGVDRARDAGLPVFTCSVRDHPDRASWDRALTEAVAEYRPDLVISAGFMKILGPAFLSRFAGRVVNTHPALLPSFPGAHGVRDALAYGVKVTGCTVHFVDEGVDTGPVIAQRAVPVRDEDDESTLHERIKDVERGLLVEAVGRLARSGYRIEGRKVLIP